MMDVSNRCIHSYRCIAINTVHTQNNFKNCYVQSHLSLVLLLLALVVLFFLSKDNQQTAENADDVVE